jgi:hypothetical protein
MQFWRRSEIDIERSEIDMETCTGWLALRQPDGELGRRSGEQYGAHRHRHRDSGGTAATRLSRGLSKTRRQQEQGQLPACAARAVPPTDEHRSGILSLSHREPERDNRICGVLLDQAARSR